MQQQYSAQDLQRRIEEIPFWYHRVQLMPGVWTPGIRDCETVLEQLELPEDCTGMRALDLGASDGFFSATLEARGAQVVALDHVPPDETGYPLIKEFYNLKVERHIDNIYNVSKDKYGEFDIVFCLGLLYHLRDPLRALSQIREVCRGDLYVESFVIDNRLLGPNGEFQRMGDVAPQLLEIPLAQFYGSNEISKDFTNWWGYNSVCLTKMLEATNFTVLFAKVTEDRAIYKCRVNEDENVRYWRTIESGEFHHPDEPTNV
jgi:tRNA (mo5U34)-methyltransferase